MLEAKTIDPRCQARDIDSEQPVTGSWLQEEGSKHSKDRIIDKICSWEVEGDVCCRVKES